MAGVEPAGVRAAQGHGNLGNLLAGARRYDEAEQEYRAAIAIARRGGHARVRRLYQNCLTRLTVARGGVAEAEDALRQTLLEKGTDDAASDARCLLALAALRDGRTALAVHRFEEAIQLRPTEVSALAFGVIAWVRHGRAEMAETWFGRLADFPIGTTLEGLERNLASAWLLLPRAADSTQRDALRAWLASFDRSPSPEVAPPSRRLVEMAWLLPPPG